MPGLNTVISFDQGPEADPKRLDGILGAMNHDPAYSSEFVYANPFMKIVFSGYQEYPRHVFESPDAALIVEGAIYNKSMEQVRGELLKILPDIALKSGKTETLRDFIAATDGEFIIYYIDKVSSTVVIFNDALGRLPAYVYGDDRIFILARAMKFMTACLPKVQPDESSLIEYFLFSYPLGDKTYFKNIHRLMPFSLFVVNYKARRFNCQVLQRYSFDDRWDDRPIEHYVKELHDLFVESTSSRANRFKDRRQIVSVSGGLDSRAVTMALLKSKIAFQPITFQDYYNLLKRDLPVVEKLNRMYNLNVQKYKLIEENIPDFERMVSLKDGTTPMGTMGSVLNSMEVIEKEYGRNVVYYTGDEGNYITAPRYGGRNVSSEPELVQQIIAKNSTSAFSIDEIAPLFGKTPQAVMDQLCHYFASYPEKEYLHKIDHFFVWERSFKFTMEGQDRIRLFFWPLAPHYGIKYAQYAFKIKNKYLAGWKLYAGLLRALDRRCVSVKYSNFGIALDSPFMSFYLPMRGLATRSDFLRRNLLIVLRLLKSPGTAGRKVAEFSFVDKMHGYLCDVIASDDSLGGYMDTEYLKKLLIGEKHLYRMYVPANLIKYLTLTHNKSKEVPVQA